MSAPSEGLVLRIDAKVCHVEVGGTTHVVPLRGRLFEERTEQVRPVAVGDRLLLDADLGAIEAVLPRRTKMARARAGEDGREQVLAANVSLVLVVAALAEPPFQPDLVDRILAGAEHEHVDAMLVLSKVDRDRKAEAGRWVELYAGLGYRVLTTSVVEGRRTDAALDELRAVLRDHVTVLSGPSGAGKSSLINALWPGFALRVGSLSRIRQGKHTTTHTQLLRLPDGGHVLDTPGIRNFGLVGVDPQAVQFLFREVRSRIGRCEYRNCMHRVEPGCTVRAAAEAGDIAATRYRSYLTVLEQVETRERGL